LTEAQPEQQTIAYTKEIEDLLNAGRLALIKDNFMIILANMIRAIPDHRIEIEMPGKDINVNLRFEFKPDKLTIWEADTPPPPVIQLASQLPKSPIPRLHQSR
jgi:hypothetical protein